MKVETELIMELIENDNSVLTLGNRILKIWLDSAERRGELGNHYSEGEQEARDFEEFVLKSYWEFYDLLAIACLKEKSVFQLYPDSAIVIMDGMSLRESVLLYKSLKNEGYKVTHKFNFSAVPSDTEFFRQKIGKPIKEFFLIRNPKDINLTGDEKYVWSYFPDVMLDKIKIGHTVISSLEEMYGIVERIVFEILKKIKTEKIVITSDHGYLRTEAGFVFSVPDKAKKKLQQIFGSKRYVKIDDIDGEDLMRGGYIKEFNGSYIVKSRYLWPVPGKYSVYIHGGLSLMECVVPVLEIER